MSKPYFKLILVTNKMKTRLDVYLNFISLCAQAGITSVQLREKQSAYADLLSFGKEMQDILKAFQIPLIVNDNPQLALELDAEGLHLGQNDGDIISARRLLGEDKIIGLTVNSIKELREANNLPIDYLGIGAIFPSTNKTDVAKIWGSEGLIQLRKLTNKKLIAIGGINETNAGLVMRSGADGIAAIAAFHESADPAYTTRQLLLTINRFKRGTHDKSNGTSY